MKATREPLFLTRGEAWILATAICLSSSFGVAEEFGVQSIVRAAKVLRRLCRAFGFGEVSISEESVSAVALRRGEDSQDVRPLTPAFFTRGDADVLACLIFATVCCTGGPPPESPQLADLKSVIKKIEDVFSVGINSQDLELEG